MERNVLRERLVNKDDKNRHFALLIIDKINKQNSYLLLAFLQSGSVPELDMHESKHFLPGPFVHSVIVIREQNDKCDDTSRLTVALMVFCPSPRPCKEKKKQNKKTKKQKTKTKHKSYGSASTMTPKANLH
jgi:hypothetical protein